MHTIKLKLKIKYVVYSSQGSHTGQLQGQQEEWNENAMSTERRLNVAFAELVSLK